MSRLYAFLYGCGAGLLLVAGIMSGLYGFDRAVDLVDTIIHDMFLSMLIVIGVVIILGCGILSAVDNHDR